MNKKTIFLIGTRWFGILGPTQEMIKKLTESGYHIFVFGQSDNHYKRYYNDNCTLVEIHMKRSYTSFIYDFLDIIKISRYILRFKPSAIHSFNPKPAFISFFSSLIRPGTFLFVGITGLGNTFIKAKRLEPIITKLFRLVGKKASFIFFQNLDDIELFKQKKIGNPKKHKIFIGPGVDLEIFTPVNRTIKQPSELTVLCVSRLIWQKGILEFCESAKEIKETYRNIKFLLVGEYDFQHPDCVEPTKLEEYIKANIIEHIPWTDKIADIYKTADIFFLHSYREGAPRAILEASASNLPTVGSDCTGVKELVINDKTGYLVPFKNTQKCIEKLIELIENNDKRLEFGDNARKMIAEPYSLINSTEAQLNMYRTKKLIPDV